MTQPGSFVLVWQGPSGFVGEEGIRGPKGKRVSRTAELLPGSIWFECCEWRFDRSKFWFVQKEKKERREKRMKDKRKNETLDWHETNPEWSMYSLVTYGADSPSRSRAICSYDCTTLPSSTSQHVPCKYIVLKCQQFLRKKRERELQLDEWSERLTSRQGELAMLCRRRIDPCCFLHFLLFLSSFFQQFLSTWYSEWASLPEESTWKLSREYCITGKADSLV